MAITSIGYDGTVDEADWSNLSSAGKSTYGVAGRSHWKVSAHATLTRGVSIATGSGWGRGVYDSSSSTVSLAGASISSGTRWDMVVARRDWSGTGGQTTFEMITGTSSKSLPNREDNPGVLDDQPIALVQFTSGESAATSIIDLRVWAGAGGGLYAKDDLVKDYMDQAGTRIVIDGEDWVSTIDGSGNQKWSRQGALNAIQLFDAGSGLSGGSPSSTTSCLIQAGTVVQSTDAAGLARITFPTPFPNGLLSITATNGDDYAVPNALFFAGSGNPAHGSSGTGDRTSWVYAVIMQDPSTKTFKNWAYRQHRINWIAIGW